MFTVDPASLRATPLATVDRAPRRLDERPEHYLIPGAVLDQTEWVGVHSASEVARDFAPGTSISGRAALRKTKEARHLYRGRVEAVPSSPRFPFRISSIEKIAGDDYFNAALLGTGTEGSPMALTDPGGFLLAYTAEPGLQGSLKVARIDRAGKRVWNVDTGIGVFGLQQILPDTRAVAFIGPPPQRPDVVPESQLVVINVQSGAVSTTNLTKLKR